MSTSFVYVSMDQFLSQARLAIHNARHTPDILAALSAFGYDEARLQEGAALLAEAESLHARQVKEYGEQYQATAALNQARQAAEGRYNTHRRLARIALKGEPERQKAIKLQESRKRSLSGWLQQASVFYANTLGDAEVLAGLARFNVTQADLEAAQAAVQQVADLDAAQEREKSEAQRATKERDAALDALGDWLADMKEVARIALADDAQMLEALQFDVVA